MTSTPAMPPVPAVPTIRGERIFLRPAERSDLPTFVRWFADGEMTHFLMARAPFSLAGEESWFNSMLEKQGVSDWFFVVCLLVDGRAIGTTGLHDLNLEEGQAEFGITLGEKDEWNKGYGTDTLRAICDFGFGQLRLERIRLDVYEQNTRAIRSYEKAGFQHEGVRRHAHFADGRHWNVLRMSLLRDEWLALPHRRAWDHLPSMER